MPISKDVFFKRIEEFRKKILEMNERRRDEHLSSVDYMLSSRIYMDTVLEDINFFSEHIDSGRNILDFGAGSGFLSDMLSLEFENVHGLDIEEADKMDGYADGGRKERTFYEAIEDKKEIWKWVSERNPNASISFYDGEKIPFADDYFNAICAYAVIEHVLEGSAEAILLELRRVTKDGGKIFISKLPQTFSITEFMAGVLGMDRHDKKFSKKEITSLLSETGWKIEKIFYSDFVFEFPPSVTNRLYYLLKVINWVVIRTPLRLLSHNLTVLATKK